jgi:hypothetical protein
MSTQDPSNEVVSTEKSQHTTKLMSRRAVLRGSVAAVPTILTLQSGAALARSSNVISASPVATTDRFGRTLCLDPDSVDPVGGSGNLFDLNDPASAHINAIRDRDHRRAPNWGAPSVRESTMCHEGGTFYHKPWGSRWQEVNVRQGVIVSATALTSFAGSIVVTDL